MKRVIATNLASEYNDNVESQAVELEHGMEKKQKLEAIMKAINALPEMMRKCIVFHAYHELSYKQIAQCLDISVNTVKTHLREGYKKIRTYKNIEILKVKENS